MNLWRIKMPLYDYDCKKCGEVHSAIMSYSEYDESDVLECQHCKGSVSRDDRIIGSNIKKIVKGVSKGNHNSNDWS
jgi:putative FmdB family regulatory protein